MNAPTHHPAAEPPVQPEQLPQIDYDTLEAICQEHRKCVDLMGRTLLGAGWRPEQAAYVCDHWPWTWIARAIAHERQQRTESPVHLPSPLRRSTSDLAAS